MEFQEFQAPTVDQEFQEQRVTREKLEFPECQGFLGFRDQ
jgi:hypothetical protein